MAFAELKARQSVMWGNGPYERITNTIRDIHAIVIERVDPQPGERVLDAATGTGAVGDPRRSARRGRRRAWISRRSSSRPRRERAAEEGVTVDFEVGDAEAMTYDDAQLRCRHLDVRRHVRARPYGGCRRARPRRHAPAGALALACWTPEGGLGQMFRMMGPFLSPPPPGAGSPFALGQRGPRARAPRRCVRSRARGARLDARDRVGRGRTGSSSRRRTARRRPPPRRSTTTAARSSTRPGSNSSRAIEKATRWSTTASIYSRSAHVAEPFRRRRQ